MKVWPQFTQPVNPDYIIRLLNEIHHQHSRHHSACQRWICHTGDTHMKSEDTDRISYHIDCIHDNGYYHGYPGIPHRAEQRCAGIIDGNKGIRKSRNSKVNYRVIHNRCFHFSKHNPQEMAISN